MQKKVAIVMGSKSDEEIVGKGVKVLEEFGIDFEIFVISAHRNPVKIKKFASTAEENGFAVIIACAGLAAHLPGVIASMTVLPVIGVPLAGEPLRGQDALYSIVQMPSGIPVATVGINNTVNGALLAVSILSVDDSGLREALARYRKKFGDDEF